MRVNFYRTGDPWMDWGIVAFYRIAKLQDRYFNSVSLGEGHLSIEFKSNISVDRYAEMIFQYLRQRMNSHILPAPEMKILKMSYHIESGDGFYDPGYAVKLTTQEREQLKGKLQILISSQV